MLASTARESSAAATTRGVDRTLNALAAARITANDFVGAERELRQLLELREAPHDAAPRALPHR